MSKPKRIIFFGAHPDDADILFGGTAIQLTRAGHTVKFVSVTNGDTGHHLLSRRETAARRYAEAQASAKITGVTEYEILNHDCGIEPSVENRREILRIIRRFKPDLVISHRLCDYHPDHRATAQLVQDTAYIVTVPHFCEDTPIPDHAPVYAYGFDHFQEPRPFRVDAAVEFDSVLDEKLAVFDCHASQFYEWLPWNDKGIKDFDVSKLNADERREHLKQWVARFHDAADNCRALLKQVYGSEKGEKIHYAEVFEQSAYGAQVPQAGFQKLLMP